MPRRKRANSRNSLWCELYFQSVHDPSAAPAGQHTMSVFAQYVPYAFRAGFAGTTIASGCAKLALDSIGRFCSNLPAAVIDAQVLGPPDIERKTGLTGGHIFQGECLPGEHVEPAAGGADLHARRLFVRRLHAPGRQRDRDQRPQRGDGGSCR